ncbi:MAG: hypothetical protein WB562_07570 [Candidatus Sulfotelmatobacter sp.]
MKTQWRMRPHTTPSRLSACVPRIRRRPASREGSRENGYVLLTLMLLAALLAFTLIMILPDTVFELKRDREQEMVHRGVQYTRAIGAYYKKFGRYPTRLEDLENTNNLRFLRKRYKDPENKNQDFKLLHFGEVKLSLSGGIGGGTIPGASAPGSPAGMNGSAPGGSAFGSSSFGGAGSGVNGSGAFSQSSSFGGTSNSAFGAGSSSPTSFGQPGTNPTSGTDASQQVSSQTAGTSGSGQVSGPASDVSSSQQQVFGGGPIIGVASASPSKEPSIREYNHKRKSTEWQFVYDPAIDRGGLITTPYQPLALSFGNVNQPGQAGQPGQPGTSSPFGASSFGSNNNSSPNPNPASPAPSPQSGNPSQPQ